MKLETVENLMFAGLLKRWFQVFESAATYTNAHEKTKTLQRMMGGHDVAYPYTFLIMNSASFAEDRYTAHMLGRRGVPFAVGDGQFLTVRLIPMNFEFDVEFYTNTFNDGSPASVISFIKRAQMATKYGYLKFQFRYGSLLLSISASMSTDIQTPQQDNVTEQEQHYKVTTTLTLKGFASESEISTQGRIEEVQVNEFYTTKPDGGASSFKAFKSSKSRK